MIDIFNPITKALAGIGDIQTMSVMRERILLLKDELEIIRSRYIELDKETADLKKQVAKLTHQLARQESIKEFVEQDGGFFKLNRKGDGYSPTVYCPACHNVMYSHMDRQPFKCGSGDCGQIANFDGFKLKFVMDKLP